MKKLFTYEVKVYNLESDELTTEFITTEIPPDLAQAVGLHRQGKEIYPTHVWELGKPIADLSMPIIRYDN